jgi:hypothetical protein
MTTLKLIFAATVLLMIAKCVTLRHHVADLGAQAASFDVEDGAGTDDETDVAEAATEGE